MGQKNYQPKCSENSLKDYNAMLLQLEYMVAQARRNRQELLIYLLGMACHETQAIIECTKQETGLQE